ncbi:oocyte zinc finger protein XlCOF26 [Loa loa]|uniref:Oocyte zinc finger protein XlCOF26 n=2 Tax=Loa loa TaxID=7209 RepID=A0A1S0TL77_LOALO|nr:oocyte zinc finger protein XlCOF26 [Loa loa]EFO15280.1 oocyte zinc finger protein XlCOF26 [Loa loa]
MEKLFLLAEVAAKMPEAKLAAKNADKFDSREKFKIKVQIRVQVQQISKFIWGPTSLGGRTVRKCSISFSRPSTLEDHRNYYDPSMLIPVRIPKTHVDEELLSINALKNHERTHIGEKPYSCRKCNESFSRLSSLKNHMKTYIDEKLHSCRECNESFRLKQCLKDHMVTYDKNRLIFNLTVCGMGFLTTRYFKLPKKNHEKS